MNNTGKKFGGRQKGTPNKTTGELKIMLANFFAQKFENMNEYFENLDDVDKIKVLLAMAKFILPAPTENNDDGTPQYTGGQFNIDKIEIIHTKKIDK